MKFFSVLLLAAAGSVFAKGNSTSTKSQCKQVQKLTKIVNLAANSTRLDDKTDGNATKADAIKAKASEAATTLSTLQANTTLMAACSQIFAVEDMEDACSQMASLEKLTALVANATKLDNKFDGNATKIAAVQAKASAGADELATLSSNTTLTQFCAAKDLESTCSSMAKLQKEVDKASNATALSEKFNGNTTKVEKAQAKASKAAEKLQAMSSNSTLVNLCASESNTKTEAAAGSSSSSAAADAESGASNVLPRAVQPMVSVLAVLAAGIFLL